MAFFLCLCLVAGVLSYSTANRGYGNVGVLSGASSSSNSDFGGQARAISANFGGNGGNTYTVGNGNVNSAPIYSVESSDDVDDMVQNGNFGSSNGASASTFSSNGGNIFVGSRGLGNNGVQVVQVDSGPAQNIGFQIQSTVQDILNRFGITMQNNVAGMSGLYQPGRTFVVRFNGAPRILNSNRYGLGNMAQSQSQYMGGQQQQQQQGFGDVGYTVSSPVVVSYKVISPAQSSPSLAFGISSGNNQGSGANVLSRASASSFTNGANNGDDNVEYVQAPVNTNSYSNGRYNQDQDSNTGYAAPTTHVPSRNRVRYIAQKNKKYESNSNVAYEQDSS